MTSRYVFVGLHAKHLLKFVATKAYEFESGESATAKLRFWTT
jgi:hypothetical protein